MRLEAKSLAASALLVWLDGQNYVGALGLFGLRMQTVTDNLVHRQQIPPMVPLLLSPTDFGPGLVDDVAAGNVPTTDYCKGVDFTAKWQATATMSAATRKA